MVFSQSTPFQQGQFHGQFAGKQPQQAPASYGGGRNGGGSGRQQQGQEHNTPASNTYAEQHTLKQGKHETKDGFEKQDNEAEKVQALMFQCQFVVRQFQCEPDAILAWLVKQGVPVLVLDAGAVALTGALNALGYQPGFIPPTDAKAFFVLTQAAGVLGQSRELAKRNGLIILTPQLNKIGFLSHQLFHWMAYKASLPGYDDEAQRLYRQYFDRNTMETLPQAFDLSIEKIAKLRHAVRREIDALSFVRQLSQQVLTPAQQRTQMLQHGGTLA
jgi:hypothetical protein